MGGPHTDYVNSKIYNGIRTPSLVNMGVISEAGCPCRGTTTCHGCPLAVYIPVECDYNCRRCPHREQCFCGWDQSGKLELMGILPMK